MHLVLVVVDAFSLWDMSNHHVTHLGTITQKVWMAVRTLISIKRGNLFESPQVQLTDEGHERRLLEARSHQRLLKRLRIMDFEGSPMWKPRDDGFLSSLMCLFQDII